MKTTDLISENQKVLDAMRNSVLQSKKHIEFLAENAPEIRTNLESVAESLQTLADMLKNQIVFNRGMRFKFAKERSFKNQAYGFIATEKLGLRFRTFCENYPTNLYIGLTGVDMLQDI